MPLDVGSEAFHIEVKHHSPLPNRYTWQIHLSKAAQNRFGARGGRWRNAAGLHAWHQARPGSIGQPSR